MTPDALDMITLTRFLQKADARGKALRELADTPIRFKAKRGDVRANADKSASEYEAARQEFVTLLDRWVATGTFETPAFSADMQKSVDDVCELAERVWRTPKQQPVLESPDGRKWVACLARTLVDTSVMWCRSVESGGYLGHSAMWPVKDLRDTGMKFPPDTTQPTEQKSNGN